jgi:hypothetical protein
MYVLFLYLYRIEKKIKMQIAHNQPTYRADADEFERGFIKHEREDNTLFRCGCCGGLPRDMVSLPCGHLGCVQCTRQLAIVKNNDRKKANPLLQEPFGMTLVHCPDCRHPFRLIDLLHFHAFQPALRLQLRAISVPCPNAELGCRFEGNFQSADRHQLYECPQRLVECPNISCFVIEPFNLMATVHLPNCTAAGGYCRTCALPVSDAELQQHQCLQALKLAVNELDKVYPSYMLSNRSQSLLADMTRRSTVSKWIRFLVEMTVEMESVGIEVPLKDRVGVPGMHGRKHIAMRLRDILTPQPAATPAPAHFQLQIPQPVVQFVGPFQTISASTVPTSTTASSNSFTISAPSAAVITMHPGWQPVPSSSISAQSTSTATTVRQPARRLPGWMTTQPLPALQTSQMSAPSRLRDLLAVRSITLRRHHSGWASVPAGSTSTMAYGSNSAMPSIHSILNSPPLSTNSFYGSITSAAPRPLLTEEFWNSFNFEDHPERLHRPPARPVTPDSDRLPSAQRSPASIAREREDADSLSQPAARRMRMSSTDQDRSASASQPAAAPAPASQPDASPPPSPIAQLRPETPESQWDAQRIRFDF